ncbi:hypothetical protein [Modestobacter altitudinis]|uniref:hypothetical protein n=1 Tax=Modestobacter altitudinis TaxID=2213158 RepID=UPI001485EC22|nr:hypothetical protein [Modestobacter altitudinis]
MPEVTVDVQWPESSQEYVYSPSTVVEDVFRVGASHPLPEFVELSRSAMTAANRRVKERYGLARRGHSGRHRGDGGPLRQRRRPGGRLPPLVPRPPIAASAATPAPPSSPAWCGWAGEDVPCHTARRPVAGQDAHRR